MAEILSVRWTQSLDTESVLEAVYQQPSEERVRAYQREIGTIWQVFEVTRNDFTWNVLKNHEEIHNFILAFNFRFGTRLAFDRFIDEGVQILCQNEDSHNWPPLRAFLEVEDGEMGKVGSFTLLKKSGGRFKDYFCCRLPCQWQNRNFVVTKAGILYYAESTKQIKEYLPFGKGFKICCGKEQTGFENGIQLEGSQRKLLLFAPDYRLFCKFVYLVKETLKQAEGHEGNPHQSFAPMRKLDRLEFLIDGERYFSAVYQALERAQWQIMICGWWISPQFQLKRPTDQHPGSRLDVVLQRAVVRGVKIYVLIYNESTFLPNDSTYTKQTLEKLSPNIKVLQHPLGVLPSFWSHHEKVVIIDQSEVLMGGFDLCYGRFDTSEHLLNHNDPKWYPGIEYNNIRTKDFANVREFQKDAVDRDEARLPWHDVGVHFSGQSAADVCHHFIEYWNYASFQTHYEDRELLVLQKDRPQQTLTKGIKNGIGTKLDTIKQLTEDFKEKLFSSNQNHNPRMEQHNHNLPMEQQKHSPRMEQHLPVEIRYEGVKIQVEPKLPLPMQADSGQLVIEIKSRNEALQLQKGKNDAVQLQKGKGGRTYRSNGSNEFKERMLLYQSETAENQLGNSTQVARPELGEIVGKMEQEIEKIDFITDLHLTSTATRNLPKQSNNQQQLSGFSSQVVRSVGSWSIGCSPSLREQSIHNAYIALISSAQHYIYIENQFFVSAVVGNELIKNHVANALYNRILRAYYQKTSFKVYIVLPLVPGFAGELDDAEAVIPRLIMHWQYQTISRGQNSLMSRLKRAGADPDNYLIFLSLRAHGVLMGRPTTEIIYLHSKLIIVDDLAAIIGSANINDRSMRGSRDSELCLLVEGRPTPHAHEQQPICNDTTIRNLRLELWREHFGSDMDFTDPASNQCLSAIRSRAKSNTNLYREVFHCYPDDEIKKLAEIGQWREICCNSQLYAERFGEIKGLAVEFPLQFLQDEDLLCGSTLYPDVLSV